MDEKKFLADQFEASRPHLKAVAYRMLGSASEAEDALQESWLRLSRSDIGPVENLGGWLTTVTARICLDMLRARKSRREEPLEARAVERAVPAGSGIDPEQEAMLADSVGIALLVVLENLAPAERIAFVLHDMFDLPFDEIAPIVGRSAVATRQLASRARRRVQGEPKVEAGELSRNRSVVDRFLAAARGGDFEGLLAVLDPEIVFRSDAAAIRMGGAPELRGAAAVAGSFKGRATGAQPVLVDGEPALLIAPGGKLRLLLMLTITQGRIATIEAVADPGRLQAMEITLLPG